MADEIDVGGIVATVRIDADKVDSTADKIVKGFRQVGTAGEKAIVSVDKLQSQVSALTPVLEKVGVNSEGAAEGIAAINEQVDSGAVEKYSAKLQSLTAEYEAQKKAVNELGAQLDYLVYDYYKLEQRLGRGDSFDPAQLFPAESEQLDKEMAKLSEIEAKIKEVTATREKAAQAAVNSAAKTSAAAQSAANAEKTAAKTANMAFDTGATALRAVTSAAGGTVSQLGYLGTELIYLKRNMQAAATTGAMMASVLSFGVMAAVTLVSAGISALQEKEEKRKQAFEDGVQNLKTYSSELQTLQQSLDVLNNTKSTTDQLTTARNNLASTFDNLIIGYNDEGEAILANNELLEKQLELTNKKISLSRQEIIANSNAIEEYSKMLEKIAAEEKRINAGPVSYDSFSQPGNNGGFVGAFLYNSMLEDSERQLIEYQQEVIDLYHKAEDEVKAYIQENLNLIDSNTGVVLSWEQLSAAQSTVGNTLILEYMDDIINKNITYEEALEDIRNKLSDSDFVDSYYTNLNNQTQNAVNNTKKLEDAYDGLSSAVSKSMSAISGVQSDLASAHAELAENGKLAQSTVNRLIGSYPQLIDYLDAETGQLNLTEDVMRDLYEIQKQLQIAELEASREKLKENEEQIRSNLKVAESEYAVAQAAVMRTGYASDAQYWSKAYAALQSAQKDLEELENSYNRIDTLIENINNTDLDLSISNKSASSGVSEYSKALEQLNHQKRMGQLTTQEEIAALEELSRKYTLTAAEQMDLEYRLYTAKKQYAEEIESARAKAVQAEYSRLENLKRMDQLTTQEEIDALEKLGKTHKLTAEEQLELEYRLYTAKKQYAEEIETARSKALREQYTQMENLKSLGELTSEQELAWLERIRQKYSMNAEERIALEIKIYNLKQELQRNEINALDELGAAITEALKNQYEEQRKAEQDRINESIAAWDEWEKSTVTSIQAEIDALEELEAEQESQSKAEEYYKKAQELKLKIAYENDDYQREQYQKELNRLSKEEQERLQKEQTDSQRKQLRQKMDEVSNTANARRAALEAELEVINDNYDKLTSALYLRAQAEKIIMQQSQEDIIELITSYAPEYNFTGQSIGESLYKGFKSKVDAIYDYVEEVMTAIINYQNDAIRAASAAADGFEEAYRNNLSGSISTNTTINYTSNFNVPVESPVQTKRAIESTADSIAAAIRG